MGSFRMNPEKNTDILLFDLRSINHNILNTRVYKGKHEQSRVVMMIKFWLINCNCNLRIQIAIIEY